MLPSSCSSFIATRTLFKRSLLSLDAMYYIGHDSHFRHLVNAAIFTSTAEELILFEIHNSSTIQPTLRDDEGRMRANFEGGDDIK